MFIDTIVLIGKNKGLGGACELQNKGEINV